MKIQIRKIKSRDLALLDLGPILYKLTDPVHGEGWNPEKAEKVAIQYRRFLTLVRENPNATIVPTEDVDEFWHNHVLDTLKYAEDCTEFFGFFLHHFPYLGLRGGDDVKRLTEAFEATKTLYAERFGESLIPTDGKTRAGDCSAGCGAVVCAAGNCSAHRPIYTPQFAPA